MNLAENIKAILTEQVIGYRTLVDILRQERECLVCFNPTGVETLSKEKDTIVLKLKLLEEERIRLVRAFAADHAVADKSVFQKLSEMTGDDSFQRLRLQLISLLQGVMELNEFNRVLIERSSSMVRNALSFLGSLGVNLNTSNKGTLLSREA
jgi:flagellar biosynthesis/type III secretory pathway chaperone